MRTDGLRVVFFSAIGVPAAVVGAMAPLGAPGHRHLAVAFVLAGGGSALVWLAVGDRRVGRAGWLATGVVGLAAFGLSLSVWREQPVGAALIGVLWWFAAVLFVVPAGQAVHAVQRARQAVREAPYGHGASGVESPL